MLISIVILLFVFVIGVATLVRASQPAPRPLTASQYEQLAWAAAEAASNQE